MVYTKTHLEDFIENIYTNIGIYHPRQLNPEEISARLRIVVDYVDGTSKCVEHSQFSLIMLNQNLSSAAQWQEFAHELCHLLRHAGNQHTLPPFFLKMQEWQVKSFALHFCSKKLDLTDNKKSAISIIAQTIGVEPDFAGEWLEQWLLQCSMVYYGN
ncbi:ImmA/IrrE family metallo-endopeptidase [Domibacillus tundrae]|uniref:ImmA/IrrE family metallo-endopeptidase n=1 Tax=Domibacillus tundrae TaxID=1587527 RepID=UPI000617D06A|nr:ImmA/IrrE family metallo-endopeptidase [Domibacillus tundrae]